MTSSIHWINDPLPMIAHRGLHNVENGIIENSEDAIKAAYNHGYGIEIDVQLSKDNVVMVFHDTTLERLTDATGLFRDKNHQQLSQIMLKGSQNTIPSLSDMLTLIPIDCPILIEIKIDDLRDDQGKIELTLNNTIACLQKSGHTRAAIMSFNPHIVAFGKYHKVDYPLGLICEWKYDPHHWKGLSFWDRLARRLMLTRFLTRPDFISYNIKEKQNLSFRFWSFFQPIRQCFWTVRDKQTALDLQRDNKIPTFEGFLV